MLGHYFIRNLRIEPALVLSPMSGVTSSAFRRLMKELNPGAIGLVITEFISVEALTRESPRSMKMMRFEEDERPLGIQIFGHDINRIRDAALMAEDVGADLVDLNCGCPAPKVVRNGGGCELMRQPSHLAQILRTLKRSLTIPLTMKIRSGWDSACINAVEIARMAEQEGVEALAIHGRTRAQLYRGEADWEIVKAVSNSVSIPVLGSGDVFDSASALLRMQSSAGEKPLAGLYVGRAALSNPFVFLEIIFGKESAPQKTELLAIAILERYIELLREEENSPEGGARVSGKVKQLATQMCKGYEWRKDILRAGSLTQQIQIMQGVADTLKYENAQGRKYLARVCQQDSP